MLWKAGECFVVALLEKVCQSMAIGYCLRMEEGLLFIVIRLGCPCLLMLDDDQSQDLAADCTLGSILLAIVVVVGGDGSTASDCHLDAQVCSTSDRCWSHRVVACIGSPLRVMSLD